MTTNYIQERYKLRLSAEAFFRLIGQNPEAAVPMLFSVARMMANRIKDQNWHFQRHVAAEFLWR